MQNPLAVELLKKESAAGTRVRIDFMDGEFTFEEAAAAKQAPSAGRS